MLASGAPSANNGWLRAIDTDGSIEMPSVSADLAPKRMRRRDPRSCGELLMQNEGIGQGHNHGQAKQWKVFSTKFSRRHKDNAEPEDDTPKRD